MYKYMLHVQDELQINQQQKRLSGQYLLHKLRNILMIQNKIITTSTYCTDIGLIE